METAAGRFSRLFSPPFFTLEVALAAARSAAVAFDVTANTRVREVVCHVVQCLGLPQDTEEGDRVAVRYARPQRRRDTGRNWCASACEQVARLLPALLGDSVTD